MSLLPETLYTNDLICLGLSALALVLILRALQTGNDDGYAGYLMIIVAWFAVIIGIGNALFNLVANEVSHAWRVALLLSGPFLIPLAIYLGATMPARLAYFKASLARRRKEAKLAQDHDRLLAELRDMSAKYEDQRVRDE